MSLCSEADWANLEKYHRVLGISGLGEFSRNELDKALAGKMASVFMGMSRDYDYMSGFSTVKDLETMFQLAYLHMTNIRKDEKSFATLMNQYETILKNKSLSPEGAFSDSITVTTANHNWRDKPFEVSDIANVNYDRILQIAKERTANAADFTFYFVGNFDEELIRQYICQYIASLPAKGKPEKYNNVHEFPMGNVVNQFTREMETPKAMSYMSWFTTSAPYDMRTRVLASMAGQLLDKIYLQKIREDNGAAYSASAFGGARMYGDQVITQIIGYVPMTPDKSDLALSIMREEMANLAISVDEASLQDIKEVMLKDFDTNVKENSYWMNVINMWDERGIDLYTGYKDVVNSITPADVCAFVQNVILAAGNHTEVTMLPAE